MSEDADAQSNAGPNRALAGFFNGLGMGAILAVVVTGVIPEGIAIYVVAMFGLLFVTAGYAVEKGVVLS